MEGRKRSSGGLRIYGCGLGMRSISAVCSCVDGKMRHENILLTMAHHSLGPGVVYSAVTNEGELPGLTWSDSVSSPRLGLYG